MTRDTPGHRNSAIINTMKRRVPGIEDVEPVLTEDGRLQLVLLPASGEEIELDFDPGDASWHQVWVDNVGTRLHLKGGYADRKMVMSGERVTPKGPVTDRISWTDNPDGTVRQFWELSTDGGETWQVLFDGLYRQAAAGSQGDGE